MGVFKDSTIKRQKMTTDVVLKEKEVSENLNGFSIEEVGDDHLFTGLETPMKPDAFKLSDTRKKEKIASLFSFVAKDMDCPIPVCI